MVKEKLDIDSKESNIVSTSTID